MLSSAPLNMPSMIWAPYTPTFEPQRFVYDTEECSQLGGAINPLEAYFNWLKSIGMLSPNFLAFLAENGYYDSNGSFSFSERFTGIMDGTSINGNTVQAAWTCIAKYGVIPRSMLNWTLADSAKFPNQSLMDAGYYARTAVTDDMLSLGKQFLSYIKEIAWGWTGGVSNGTHAVPLLEIQRGLQVSPVILIITIPTPVGLWNQQLVPAATGTSLDHAVTLYMVDVGNPYPFFITDQYQPYKKQMAAGYPLWIAISFFIVLA